ncbi:RNA polymerase III subunit E isoform X2 [Lycorma delicatula]|uniref:RNA polymerase III subunit E isoform X2 n=1 Tax=Lycorma delicatula TaxID=130591 RepID=UPI003F51A8EA
MSEDDGDPVIEEVPVYLSHDLADHLFIYQYPVRPANNSFDNANIIKCSIKPEHQEVSMEFAMDTQTNNYDISHGEQIALNVDGSREKPHQERCFQSPLMDKTSLQSVKVLADIASTAVASFSGKHVVLSPLTGIISLQPSFPYLDLTEKRAREELKERGSMDFSAIEEEEDKDKQITVKFARQESERMKRARERSFNYLSMKSAEEPWYDTNYYPSTSRESEMERQKLQLSKERGEDETSSLCLKPQQYIQNLLPSLQEESWIIPSLPSNVLSLTAIKALPLSEQVRLILRDVKVMTFGQLSSLLVGCGDLVKLLRNVQQAAVLVLGNWVIRSDFLYPKESFSTNNGVPGEIMARARDYVLYLLGEADGKYIDRRQIATILKLPPEELKEILVQVARPQPSKGWTFILPQDKDFIEKFNICIFYLWNCYFICIFNYKLLQQIARIIFTS